MVEVVFGFDEVDDVFFEIEVFFLEIYDFVYVVISVESEVY